MSSSTAIVPVPPPVARQEAYAASDGQPCPYCQHHSSHSYFESMNPDTDTDSDPVSYTHLTLPTICSV
eukprot:8127528-Prorocentrum_lima.AAC.1